MFFRFFTVSLRAKASMTNCRFSGSPGAGLLRWIVGLKRRTVVNTSFPSSSGIMSSPAET